jgi:hypothetical protein
MGFVKKTVWRIGLYEGKKLNDEAGGHEGIRAADRKDPARASGVS